MQELSQTATQEQLHPPAGLQHSATREHLPEQKLPVRVRVPRRQEQCHRPRLLQTGFQNFPWCSGEAGRARHPDPEWILTWVGDPGHALLPFIPDFHMPLASSPFLNWSHWQRHSVFLDSTALSPCLCARNPSAPTQNKCDRETVRLWHP